MEAWKEKQAFPAVLTLIRGLRNKILEMDWMETCLQSRNLNNDGNTVGTLLFFCKFQVMWALAKLQKGNKFS